MRAQADKQNYTRQMRNTLENTDHLTIRQAEVAELMVEDGVVKGCQDRFRRGILSAKRSSWLPELICGHRCIYGDVSNPTGPNGLQAATHLTDSLRENGVEDVPF